MLSTKLFGCWKAIASHENKLVLLLSAALHDNQPLDRSNIDLQTTARTRQGHQSSGRLN